MRNRRPRLRLAQRGYEVVGVDLSDGMLAAARTRASAAGVQGLELVLGDIRTLRLDRQFDAVICMFAVLGYQTTDADVAATLATVREHLRPGGRFAFDVWYGPAVEATGPSARVKVVPTPDGSIERSASAILEPDLHLCTVHYHLVQHRIGQPDVVVNESHRMRYFFEPELTELLKAEEIRILDIAPFPATGEGCLDRLVEHRGDSGRLTPVGDGLSGQPTAQPTDVAQQVGGPKQDRQEA